MILIPPVIDGVTYNREKIENIITDVLQLRNNYALHGEITQTVFLTHIAELLKHYSTLFPPTKK